MLLLRVSISVLLQSLYILKRVLIVTRRPRSIDQVELA